MIRFYLSIFITLTYFTLFGQWENLNLGNNESNLITSIDFRSDLTGVVVSGNKIYLTSNGGDTWDLNHTGSAQLLLEDIRYINENKLIAVGKDFGQNLSIVCRSFDGGVSWEESSGSSTTLLVSAYFHDEDIGFTCGGNGTILKTSNGGSSWDSQNSGVSTNLKDIKFINSQVGFVAGGSPLSGTFLKTTDGGITWVEKGNFSQDLNSTFFINQNIVFVVGSQGAIYKSIDCGENWVLQNSVNMNGNLEISFTDSNTGYIAGGRMNESSVQKTIDQGSQWFDISPISTNGLTSISFPSFDVGYTAGANGQIYKTNSGGVSSTIDFSKETDFVVYPNPFNEIVNFKLDKESIIKGYQIFNHLGLKVCSLKGDFTTNSIDLGFLKSGIYFINLEFDNSSRAFKLSKI